MKIISTIIILLLSQTVMANEQSKGQQLFTKNCASCHGNAGGMDMNKRVAPPVVAVKMHYIKTYSDKDSFVAAVTDWVKKPEKENSLMRGAINRFGLMPTVKVSQQDAEIIAGYIFDAKLSSTKKFNKHFEKHHGK